MSHLGRALAYLDAGTGSLIASAIVGGAASVAVFFKMFGRRFVALFSSKKRAELKAMRTEREVAAAGARETA